MAINQPGSLALQLSIGGLEIPLGPVVDCFYVHLNCSTKTGVPMLHLKLTDSVDFLLDSKIMYDGSPIVITIGIPDVSSTTYKFKMNSFRAGSTSAQRIVEIDGYPDNSLYWNYTSSTPIRSTSSNAIKSIADFCGLKFSGDATSDTQVWYPTNKYMYEFAQDIAKHGYKNDKSCMVLANDLSGTLVYKDVTQMSTPAHTLSVGEVVQGADNALDLSAVTNSGSLNHFSGYSSAVGIQSVISKNRNDLSKARLGSKPKVMMNASETNAVSKGSNKVSPRPISVGNDHLNYEAARYQNARIAGLYCVEAQATFSYPVGYQLLDVVKAVVSNEQRPALAQYSAMYVITGKVIFTEGRQYYEKYEMRTIIANLSSSNELLSA